MTTLKPLNNLNCSKSLRVEPSKKFGLLAVILTAICLQVGTISSVEAATNKAKKAGNKSSTNTQASNAISDETRSELDRLVSQWHEQRAIASIDGLLALYPPSDEEAVRKEYKQAKASSSSNYKTLGIKTIQAEQAYSIKIERHWRVNKENKVTLSLHAQKIDGIWKLRPTESAIQQSLKQAGLTPLATTPQELLAKSKDQETLGSTNESIAEAKKATVRAEKERLAHEKLEAEKQAEAARLEKERLANEKQEAIRRTEEAKAAQVAKAEQLKQEKLQKEQAELAKKEALRLEQERIAYEKQQAEAVRLEKEREAQRRADDAKAAETERQRLAQIKADQAKAEQLAAQAKKESALAKTPIPMEFNLVTICERQDCKLGIEAKGWITAQTGQRFRELSQSLPADSTVILDSMGGDLLGGIELGQAIRDKRFNTRIGINKQLNSRDRRFNLATSSIQPGNCQSACAIAFLGGIKRQIADDDIYGVHSIRSTGNQKTEQTNKAVSALSRYIEDMGADRRMIDYMLLAKGNEFKRIPSRTAKQLSIDNSSTSHYPWRLQATDNGQLITLVTEKQAKGYLTLTLAISKENNTNFKLMIYAKPITGQMSNQAFEPYFSNAPAVLIQADQTKVSGKVASPWRKKGEGFQMVWLLNSEQVNQLAEALEFSVQIDFPNHFSQADRYTLFGSQGLKQSLMAMKK